MAAEHGDVVLMYLLNKPRAEWYRWRILRRIAIWRQSCTVVVYTVDFIFSKLTVTRFRTITTVQLYCYVPAAGPNGGDQTYRADKLRTGCVFDVAFHWGS